MTIRGGLLPGAVIHRNKATGSRFPVVLVLIFSLLAFSILFLGRGLFAPASGAQDDFPMDSSGLDVNWRQRLASQHLKSLFSKEVMDVIKASTVDIGPLSVDFFRKNNMSASWKFFGLETATDNNVTSAESTGLASNTRQETSRGKQEYTSNEDHSRPTETPAMLVRRQLREKRREKRAADLVNQDDEVTVKLENAAIEHSNSVDSAVLGKYSIWRKENENENSDSNVRLIRDQMIMARVYISLARMKNKTDLANELQNRLKESERSLGDATTDSELQRS